MRSLTTWILVVILALAMIAVFVLALVWGFDSPKQLFGLGKRSAGICAIIATLGAVFSALMGVFLLNVLFRYRLS